MLGADRKTKNILHTAFEISERLRAWKLVYENSLAKQQLSGELMAINEEFQATNEDLSALNEEFPCRQRGVATLLGPFSKPKPEAYLQRRLIPPAG